MIRKSCMNCYLGLCTAKQKQASALAGRRPAIWYRLNRTSNKVGCILTQLGISFTTILYIDNAFEQY